jgi:exonuclease SbcC
VVADIRGRIQGLKDEDESIRMGMGVRVQPYGEISPDRGAEDELIQRLAKRREEYQRRRGELESAGVELDDLHLRQQALPREHERLGEEARSLAAETESLQGRIADLKARRDVQFGSLDPEGERRSLEDEISRLEYEERELAREMEPLRQSVSEGRAALPECIEEPGRLQSAFEEVEASLHEAMQTAGFSELVQVRSQLAVLDEAESILDRANAMEQVLHKARSRATEVEAALEAVPKSSLAEELLEGISVRIGEEEKLYESLQARLDESERALREVRDAEHEHREILAAIAVQEKVYDETLAEQKLLRMRDAAETMKKRQRLMLNRLLDRANEHLALLSGRYLLRCVDQNGLGIDVEDALQGRIRRAVKTLSGGESFQVSLCLALGLAQMAASHRKIESLFLDEGFGALDDEMLYKVMAALKGLRANGRMVGIISHVKRLADEIPTQIRVDRAPDGSSRITVVA